MNLTLLADGSEAMCASPEVRKAYNTFAGEIGRMMKYLDRDDVDQNARSRMDAILAVQREMQKKRKHININPLMVEINRIINENIEIEQPGEAADPPESRQFDISRIDFKLLAREFEHVKRKNLMLKDLEDLIRDRLDAMMAVNPSRVDYTTAAIWISSRLTTQSRIGQP